VRGRGVQPGIEKVLGRPYSSLSVLKRGPTRKLERDFLQDHVVIGEGIMASS